MKNRLLILLGLSISTLSQAYALPAVIDNSSYPGTANPANTVIPATPSNTAMLELMARLDQLQAEVRQLTGKIEEQAHQISELKKQQKRLSADFDERLVNLENNNVNNTKDNSTDAIAEPETDAAEEVSETAAEKTPNQVVPVPDNEKQAYQNAYQLLRHGSTDQSIAEFKTFLERYPNSDLANNAQYWLAEAYRVKRDDNAARSAFNEVINKYPGARKVPDALLKLGYIALEQNQLDQARDYLNRVVNEYPNTQPALLAERKLATLDAN